MDASIRRMKGHFEILAEAMQSRVHEESLSNPKKENATTILSNGENVDIEVIFDFFDYLPNVSGKEIGKEQTEEQTMEADDVSFKAPLLYEESVPYVPHIAHPCRLHKSNWYRLFSKLFVNRLKRQGSKEDFFILANISLSRRTPYGASNYPGKKTRLAYPGTHP